MNKLLYDKNGIPKVNLEKKNFDKWEKNENVETKTPPVNQARD